MPICDMRFENGIFFARQTGRVEQADAEQWVTALAQHAASSPVPIVALIDARDLNYLSTNASQVFVRGSATPNVKVAIVAAKSAEINQRSRSMGLVSKVRSTHDTLVFRSLEEAERCAQDWARQEA
jgi:hypothetical protein